MEQTEHHIKLSRRLLPSALALLTTLLITGCGTTTYNITTDLSSTMQTPDGVYPSLEVDIVALNQDDSIRFMSYSTDEYFQPNNPYRKNLNRYTMFFSEENFKPHKLSEDNPIWAKWNKHGATRLLIIGNLPGVWKFKSGKLDPRRMNLPLDSNSWPNGNDIKVQVKPSGLTLQTPLNSPVAAAK